MPPVYEPFPLGTPNDELIAWQRRALAELELRYGRASNAVAPGTFESDALKYLKAVAAMPDIKGRTAHIRLWIALFRDRRRHTIKPTEIRAQRDQWLTVGPKRVSVDGGGKVDRAVALSPATVAKRMRALENLWTVLDGPKAYNPVREVPEPKMPKARPRQLSYDQIEAILNAMPDRGQALRGKKRSDVSKTKARLRLMAYTGVTRTPMIALKRGDFRLDAAAPAIRLKPRGKGRGAPGGWVPVPADAIAAMQAFADADAWGTFSSSSMRTGFRRACEAAREAGVKLPDNLTPYQLRHSYASAIVQQTGDMLAAQRLLQHASASTTMGYAQSEIDPWLAAAVSKVKGLKR